MPPKDTNAIDWDFILSTIEAERCVLFLGPEIFAGPDGTRLSEALVKSVGIENNPDILTYYPEDNFFLFSSAGAKTKSYYKIKKFYEQPLAEAPPLLEKIARMPFHLIISVTPDNQLASVMDRLELNYLKGFYWKNQKQVYWKNQKQETFRPPNKDNPLIYNLFGNIDQEESLVLTHDDLFDYFKSIFGARGLPEELNSLLSDAHNFIFLGLQFEKWYMQLLLRLLYLRDDRYKFARYAANRFLDEKVKALCIKQFRIEFIQNNISQFVDELFAQCESKGLLREKGKESPKIHDNIRKLLREDLLKEALEELTNFLEPLGDPASKLLDEADLLSGRYRRLQSQITKGTLDEDEVAVETNKIRESIQNLANNTKEFA